MSTGPRTGPPRLATALIRITMSPGSVRDTILGDLAQEFYEIAVRGSPRQAVRWYWRQAASVAACSLADGLRGRPWSRPHRVRHDRNGHGQPGILGLARSAPGRTLDGVGRDLRFAVRQLSGRPGFTFIAILSLALGLTLVFALLTLAGSFPFRSVMQLGDLASDGWGRGDGTPPIARVERYSLATFCRLLELDLDESIVKLEAAGISGVAPAVVVSDLATGNDLAPREIGRILEVEIVR